MDNIRSLRRVARHPKSPRLFERTQDADVTRNRRRRPLEVGESELESRAIGVGRFAGATLPERIVYKKLTQLIGEGNFIFQRSEFGGRNILGGYVLDFIVTLTYPGIVIEILGSHWHQKQDEARDLERALTVQNLGYEYHEIWDTDIFQSDERLEEVLRPIVIDRFVTRGYLER